MFDKRLFVVFIFFFFSNLKAEVGDSMPILKFDIDTVDFGIVNEGDTVVYDFWFTNVGTKDLVIKQAYPACGCTYPSFSKGAIKPGERGFIHVEFHSEGWGGQTVVKEVIIILDTPQENYYARFKAKIVNLAFQKEVENYKKAEDANVKKSRKERRKDRKKKKKAKDVY